VEQTALNGEGVIPMQIQALSFEKLVGTVAVILLLVGVYNTIMSAIKNPREEKRLREQPVNTLESTVEDHSEKLKNDHERITQLEESNRIIMRALMAVMSHEVNGNSTEKLQSSMNEIQDFLIAR
jgi:hypothetical protein